MSATVTLRPPDVALNGCLWCGGPALFVHGTQRLRDCDRCGALWDAELWGEALAVGIMALFGCPYWCRREAANTPPSGSKGPAA